MIFKVGSVNGLVGFLVVFLPSIADVVLFLGDNELIQHTAALPISRTQLVIAKYLSTYLFGGLLVILTILITWFFSGFNPDARVDFLQLISLRGFIFAIMPITLIVGISYPLLFKFGLKLGVKILLISFAIFYAVGTLIGERMIKTWLEVERRGIFASAMALFREGENYFGVVAFYILMISILLIVIVGSIYLSVFWMKRKDLN